MKFLGYINIDTEKWRSHFIIPKVLHFLSKVDQGPKHQRFRTLPCPLSTCNVGQVQNTHGNQEKCKVQPLSLGGGHAHVVHVTSCMYVCLFVGV